METTFVRVAIPNDVLARIPTGRARSKYIASVLQDRLKQDRETFARKHGITDHPGDVGDESEIAALVDELATITDNILLAPRDDS